MIVVDASALLEALLHTSDARGIEKQLFESGHTLHAPHLLDIEVAQVIRRFAAAKEISGDQGRAAVADLVDFPIRRYPHGPLLPRVWELRHTMTAYDAVYVALAEALAAPLLTRDKRLSAAARRHAEIELL